MSVAITDPITGFLYLLDRKKQLEALYKMLAEPLLWLYIIMIDPKYHTGSRLNLGPAFHSVYIF
ncbi:hypothetical protein DT065_11545 [Salicibibacter kimchii]|uniref:Uncharacterized protein n=1 Tax=Salicibibacter kimchii TaxID=2099786 RepID=A0A345C063_9BACI|nr:hypothetical protein DT065_11545 [Salicibibacter kimchii]